MHNSIESRLRVTSPSSSESIAPSRSGAVARQLWVRLSATGPALPFRLPASDALSQAPLRLAIAPAQVAGWNLVAGGGEPLQRPDLWQILPHLKSLGPRSLRLCTSGSGLTREAASALADHGVDGVHVPFHSARRDAHDWLVGRAGALKTAHRAIQTCLEAGIPVTAEVVLTRPTAAVLPETIEFLGRNGVRSVSVRRLRRGDCDDDASFVPLSPRLSLLEGYLQDAAATALQRRMRMVIRDLPVCVAPRLRPLFSRSDQERWLAWDGSEASAPEAATRCNGCPGHPHCCGAPRDYIDRFGCEEFTDFAYAPARIAESVTQQQQGMGSPALVLGWHGPNRFSCRACGDPQGAVESPRVVRARLVQAARHRPGRLRLVGAELLAHPQAAGLLFDAVRLFPEVHVAAEASPVASWSDIDLRRLKELARLDIALYGPDAARHDAHCGIPGAFAAMQHAVERLRAEAGDVRIGSYGVLHHGGDLADFADAWQRGDLPGEPRFRLSAAGDSLDDLLQCVQALPVGPARTAVEALLPSCLKSGQRIGPSDEITTARTLHFGRVEPYQAYGSDPIGTFEPCLPTSTGCGVTGCPGRATGWHSTARTTIHAR